MDFESFRSMVQQALAEDIGSGDITTESLVSPEEKARASIIARQKLVVAGLPIAEMVFKELDPSVFCRLLVTEGESARAGTALMEIEGSSRAILSGERTALNFLQHLCGTATLTARFVRKAKNQRIIILDTRKTIPGLRKLQKYAIRMGGGENHRFGLYESILIKDNHLKIVAQKGIGKIQGAINMCRADYPEKEIEVEVENLEELEEALEAGADVVLLDNFSPEELAEAVKITQGRTRLEASGGINLANIAAVADSGVDTISLGCLTHSAPAVDISLEIEGDLTH